MATLFDQYFYYAIDHMGRSPGALDFECSDSRMCQAMDGQEEYCCARALLETEANTGNPLSLFRCIDSRVVDMNREVSYDIEGMEFRMECVGGDEAKLSAKWIGFTSVWAAAVALLCVSLF